MYAGLKIEDEAALLEAKSFREKWLCSIRADLDPVNIDLALAQIAEMEAAQTPTTPPTWNDALNAMSAEEKSHAIMNIILVVAMDTALCSSEIEKILNSPYDGGKAQEGAE